MSINDVIKEKGKETCISFQRKLTLQKVDRIHLDFLFLDVLELFKNVLHLLLVITNGTSQVENVSLAVIAV